MKKVAFLLDGFGNRRHYFQILALKEAGFDPKIITFEEAKEGYLHAKRIPKDFFIILPFSRRMIMKKFSIGFARALLRVLKEESIQIVLTHRYKLLRYLWFSKLFHPDLKIIFHMVIAEAIKGWHQKFWFKRFKKYIDKILVNSKALKEELINKNLVREDEVEILYSGVDVNEFEVPHSKKEAREIFEIGNDAFIFGMIAQFRKEKDQKGLIQALKILRDKGYKVKLVLAGNGPKLEEAIRLSEKLKVKEEVIFLGKIDPLKVPLLLKAFDAFVYATFREGMPLAVLEAMAAGLPIVATDAEGIPDIFQSKRKFGYMIPKGNIEKLAEAMEELLNLPEKERLEMGKEAKERIKEAFSLENLKEHTLKIFQNLTDLN
ncbi:MAG: glycosyltransferase family 4 protein [Caldimicrobium sp.]